MIKPTPNNPKFGIISPTQYLSTLSIKSDFHLTLAHLIDSDVEYRNFYRERSEAGDFIIMDNGAFELGESYPPNKLIALGKSIDANVIVLPDYPFQPASVTMEAAIGWAAPIKDAGFQTMYIPQSERGDFDGWVKSYCWGNSNTLIDALGISILAAPSALPHIPASYARVVLMELLKDRGVMSQKYHHCFGIIDVALEVDPLLRTGVVCSIDSSNPVWYGLLGHKYNEHGNSFVNVSKLHIPHVNFDMTFDHRLVEIANFNVDRVLDIFKM